MKKNFIKATFAVAAIVTVGLGSYKAYGSYTAANMSEEDILLMENVLAISETNGHGDHQFMGYIKCKNDKYTKMQQYCADSDDSKVRCSYDCGVHVY